MYTYARVISMPKLGERLFGKKEIDIDDYVELNLKEYEGALEDEPAELYVKIAVINSLKSLPDLKREVYNGNVVIVDISSIRNDKILIDRVIKDLKQVVIDIRGDIAGLGDDQLVITPTSIRIDRSKIITEGF